MESSETIPVPRWLAEYNKAVQRKEPGTGKAPGPHVCAVCCTFFW